MSFILDALKKSEAERQRQAGPTLLELRITHPRRRYPLWSLIVGALLATNIAVLLIFLLTRTPAAPAPSVASASGGPSVPGTASTSVPAEAAATAVRVAVPPLAPAPATATATATAASGADNGPDVSAQTRNPADYEPALPPASQPQAAAPISPAGIADYSNLPSISQLSGNVPAMQLDLLDYSDVISERYALINMQRVHEGDVLPDGARVLAITPNGVAMNYRGQDFLLRPGGTAQ